MVMVKKTLKRRGEHGRLCTCRRRPQLRPSRLLVMEDRSVGGEAGIRAPKILITNPGKVSVIACDCAASDVLYVKLHVAGSR